MKLLLIVSTLLITGCTMTSKQVKVLTSKSDINVKNIELEDKDTLLCDPEGCRKLKY